MTTKNNNLIFVYGSIGYMKKWFATLYYVNLGIILLALLSPVVEWANRDAEYPWGMKYYAVLILLSGTFCLSFLGLNIYGMVKHRQYRTRYLWTAILMFVWFICGMYQLVYAYAHDIVL